MKRYIQKIKQQYEHLIMPLVLVGGFVIDIFTLNQIDQIFDNAIFITYLIFSGGAISLLFSRGIFFGKRFLNPRRIYMLQALLMFSFSALFSGFIIFYSRSGSLLTSWPFILIMITLMLGTEFKKRYFYGLRLQIVIFTVAIMSWVIFFVPVVIKKIGPWIFVLSIFISLFIISGFLFLLKKINAKILTKHLKPIIIHIIGIVLIFNFLYFTNILPPIPLSLKYKAVYYDIESLHLGYRAQYEKTPWYVFWQKRSRNMFWQPGEDLFVFTQIFTPTKTTINHLWESYNKDKRQWKTKNIISIPILSGRSDGYRGFSQKSQLSYGLWRVKTQTLNGQTLGILHFRIHPYGDYIRRLVFEEL